MSIIKQKTTDDKNIFIALSFLAVIMVILIVLTTDPSAGPQFVDILDKIQQTIIVATICFVAMGLIAYLIVKDRDRIYKKYG